MAESNTDAETAAVKAWYTQLLQHVVKEMVRLRAVQGHEVKASPIWMIPNQILISKVWGIDNESDFVWTISIDKFIADYVAGTLASNPREVARHFSLKWQMDADRILSHGQENPPAKKIKPEMQAYSKQLIQYAETLYDLTNDDTAWQQLDEFRS